MATFQGKNAQIFVGSDSRPFGRVESVDVPEVEKIRAYQDIMASARGLEFSVSVEPCESPALNLFFNSRYMCFTCDLETKSGKWFGPETTFHNMRMESVDIEGSVATVEFGGWWDSSTEISFSHRWHRPLWWVYQKWVRFRAKVLRRHND